MVINRLKSVNDAVLTVLQPAVQGAPRDSVRPGCIRSPRRAMISGLRCWAPPHVPRSSDPPDMSSVPVGRPAPDRISKTWHRSNSWLALEKPGPLYGGFAICRLWDVSLCEKMVDNPAIAQHIYLARPAVPRRSRSGTDIRTRRGASRGYYPAVHSRGRMHGVVLGGTFAMGGRLR